MYLKGETDPLKADEAPIPAEQKHTKNGEKKKHDQIAKKWSVSLVQNLYHYRSRENDSRKQEAAHKPISNQHYLVVVSR